jgi:hypothetical protein
VGWNKLTPFEQALKQACCGGTSWHTGNKQPHLEAGWALRVGQGGRQLSPDLGGGARREEAAAAVYQSDEGLVPRLGHAAACDHVGNCAGVW